MVKLTCIFFANLIGSVLQLFSFFIIKVESATSKTSNQKSSCGASGACDGVRVFSNILKIISFDKTQALQSEQRLAPWQL